MSGWAWLIWAGVTAGAALAAGAGGLLIAFAIGGQRRCEVAENDADPVNACGCCGYDLRGLEDGVCPECGASYRDDRRVPLRRRLRAALAGTALMLLAAVGGLAPEAIRHGPWAAVPNAVLVAGVWVAPLPEATGRVSARAGGSLWGELQARADAQRLRGWERRMLAAGAGAALRHGCADRRVAAAELLGSAGAEAATAADDLLAALVDPSPRVRCAVLRAAARIAAAQSGWGAGHSQIVGAMMGTAVCDRDAGVRREAIASLARLGAGRLPEAADGVWARAAADPSPQVRARAVYAKYARPLQRAQRARDLALAARAWGDPHASVREAAVTALARLSDSADGAVVLLGLSLRDPSADVRQSAARCLARLGCRAAPAWAALVASLDDGDEVVRSSVRDALGAIGS